MQPNNQLQQNNPWGFQAKNWSRPMTRGPPPQQTMLDMHSNRFGSPPGQRNMRPNFQSQPYGQHIGPQNQGMGLQNPRMSFGQPRFQNNQTGLPNQNRFQGPPQQCHQGPHNNPNNFFNGPQGPLHNRPPRQNSNQQQMFNRPPTRQMVGPPPDFFRAPGSFQQRPRFQKGKQQGEKKIKVNKRDLPENNKYYCDSCDRGYKDEDKYKLHCDQHEKCPKEGCTYVAAGRLVQLHIKLQHNSGMAKKIWSIASKEDIQKWIEERKKNFPTAENIEKKKALLAERIARGEVIEEKYFGKMHRKEDNRRGRGRGRGRDRGRGRRDSRGDMNQQNTMKRKHDDTDAGECSSEKQVKENSGEGNLMKEAAESLGMFFAAASSGSDSSGSDDDDSNIKVNNSTGSTASAMPEVTAAGALGSLMSSYVDSDESSEEEDTEKPENVPVKKTSDEPKCESKEVKEEQNNNDNKKPRHRNRARQKKNKDKWNPPAKIDKSLLEKLLAKEIRQERNKIMQCVHYIVKNNFFENSQNTENKT
ncbi:FMR1-interacting protein NUFIP1-like [Mercenaria mercenaria]|uniref:FMR1-interacting protein NUFIP1-like n=1 Tax=Mercenaria mercenaria TaxID=6596 RepID=UPI00234F7EBD|nr:FMR1-interacting protein NUFIP1-like [Mercenaria mercenaria]